jgi:arginine/lysine/histidine/glutamine transport system substrate-binding and permease protein
VYLVYNFSTRRQILRILKYTLLILGISMACIACGGKQEGPDASASMKKYKAVRIATDAVNIPFEFGSGTGVQGLDVDIGEAIGKELGYEVKWVKIPYERLLEILQNGEAELVISAVAVTPELQKDFAFSKSYFEDSNTIAHRRDRPEIKDLASLAGKKVGVQTARTGDKFMATQKVASNVSVVKFKTMDDALGALNRMEIDAVVGDDHIMTYSIWKSYSMLITTGSRLTSEKYAVVVRKGEKRLLATVNETLDKMKKEGALDALPKKWFQDVMEQSNAAIAKYNEDEILKATPKMVTCNILKTAGAWNMSRLDGYTLVLVGSAGTFASEPILTEGMKGNCKFKTAIPPGEYKLNMTILKMTTVVNIPKVPKNALTLDMNIGASGVTINSR